MACFIWVIPGSQVHDRVYVVLGGASCAVVVVVVVVAKSV